MLIPKDDDILHMEGAIERKDDHPFWTVYLLCYWWLYRSVNEDTDLSLETCIEWPLHQGKRHTIWDGEEVRIY